MTVPNAPQSQPDAPTPRWVYIVGAVVILVLLIAVTISMTHHGGGMLPGHG